MKKRRKASIIVPCRNAERTLQTCLEAVASQLTSDCELIVVDDGSRNDVAAICAKVNARLVTLAESSGRGPARNAGAAIAEGDVFIFIDADVVVLPGTVDAILDAFQTRPECAALFGSYDDAPREPNLVSQYRNLLHHHTHQTSGPTAFHFWTGLGAVKRDWFERLGGFSEGKWAHYLEDVEIGVRLVDQRGVIHVFPEIQGKHLKKYSLISMAKSDLLERAVPWVLLIWDQHLPTNRFVVSVRQKCASVAVAIAILAAGALPLLPGPAAIVFSGALTSFVVAERKFLRFLAQKRSFGFAVRAIPLHLVHYACRLLSVGVAVTVVVSQAFRKLMFRRVPPEPVDLA